MSDIEPTKKVHLDPEELDLDTLEVEDLERAAGGVTEDFACDGSPNCAGTCTNGGNCACPEEPTMAFTCAGC